jgi:hypothetical protein
VEVQLHAFLTSILDVIDESASCASSFIALDTHWLEFVTDYRTTVLCRRGGVEVYFKVFKRPR